MAHGPLVFIVFEKSNSVDLTNYLSLLCVSITDYIFYCTWHHVDSDLWSFYTYDQNINQVNTDICPRFIHIGLALYMYLF